MSKMMGHASPSKGQNANLRETKIQAQRQYQLAWILDTIATSLKSVIRILRDIS